MGTIYRNGTAFIGSGGAGGVELTQAEYDALPTTEKMNGSIYFISDGEASYPSASTMRYDNSTSGLTATSVQDAVDEVNEKVNDNAGDIAELNNGLSNLNSQISNMKVVMLNTGDKQYIDILFSETAVFFRIDCMNRRASAKPFSALVQKYSNTTNYVVNSNDTTDAGNFTCSNISGGIRVKMPFTYAYAMISGVVSFTVSAVS